MNKIWLLAALLFLISIPVSVAASTNPTIEIYGNGTFRLITPANTVCANITGKVAGNTLWIHTEGSGVSHEHYNANVILHVKGWKEANSTKGEVMAYYEDENGTVKLTTDFLLEYYNTSIELLANGTLTLTGNYEKYLPVVAEAGSFFWHSKEEGMNIKKFDITYVNENTVTFNIDVVIYKNITKEITWSKLKVFNVSSVNVTINTLLVDFKYVNDTYSYVGDVTLAWEGDTIRIKLDNDTVIRLLPSEFYVKCTRDGGVEVSPLIMVENATTLNDIVRAATLIMKNNTEEVTIRNPDGKLGLNPVTLHLPEASDYGKNITLHVEPNSTTTPPYELAEQNPKLQNNRSLVTLTTVALVVGIGVAAIASILLKRT